MRQLHLVTRVKIWQLWRGSKKTSLVLVGVLGILLSTQAVHAAAVYNFEDDGTGAAAGTILAQLTLDGVDPWFHTEVLGLTFTVAGDGILGLGVGSYAGVFDETADGFDGGFIVDVAGDGLIGNSGLAGVITDNNPPVELGVSVVRLIAGIEANRDKIFVTGPGSPTASGDWKLVPEPGSLGLAIMAMVGVGSYRRRRHG